MRYFLVAGEASGDNLGAELVEAIRAKDPGAEFAFWGGDNMAAAVGLPPKQHIRQLAFMGFVEVVANLRTITKLMAQAKRDVAAFRPEALVCIDYPGFNLRLAKWARQQGLWVDFYVSPQIWAWRPSRVHGIIRGVDRVLCILPFERDFYRSYGYEVDYVGHPLPRRVDSYLRPPALQLVARPEASTDAAVAAQAATLAVTEDIKILALLPGSRQQEVKVLLPPMLAAVQLLRDQGALQDWQIVIAAAPTLADEDLRDIAHTHGILASRSAYDVLSCARLALVASGSATLETALFNVPQVVCYKGSTISVAIARKLVQIDYIALPNLILNRPVIPELIQQEVTPQRLATELLALMQLPRAEAIRQAYAELRDRLAPYQAAAAAAQLIVHGARIRGG